MRPGTLQPAVGGRWRSVDVVGGRQSWSRVQGACMSARGAVLWNAGSKGTSCQLHMFPMAPGA